MQRALTDLMTGFETAVKNSNKAARTRTLDEAFLNAVQAKTKNSAEAPGKTSGKKLQKGSDTRSI